MELQKKKKYIFIALTAIIILTLAAILTIFGLNKYSLELNILEKTITLEYGVDEMPEITALCKGTLIHRKGIPVKTVMKGEVDLEKLGTYKVTFTAKYKNMTLSEKRTFIVADTLPPEIALVSDPNHFTSPVGTYEEEGFTATDNHDGDLTSQVVREEHDGIVTYTVTDSSGNKASVDRTIVYKDVVPPTITLTNGIDISINIGKDFSDPGFTAADDCDGDLTQAVTVKGNVDGHKYGTYTLTYRVADSSGNVCEIKRTVKIGDFTAPVIALQGETFTYVKVGTNYADPGFTASDNIDGDLTSKVAVTGGVDTSKMGRNYLTYTVTDAAGNTTTVKRSIFVYQKQAISNPVNPGDKVVYLTFDDGPGPYTARLLDILDKYGVKATFFVTSQPSYAAYQNMIGETFRRGHTIALHTYSHDYSNIYSSEDAYYNDLARINDVCISQTGVAPTIVRFPGGTNNTVSRKYCSGIMTTLSQSLSYHGYLYCDWNVSSGDAGGTTNTSTVVSNVISGIQSHNVSVVLQHDIKGFSVEAVDQIVFWGLEHGYTFLPLTDSSPMVHFTPKN